MGACHASGWGRGSGGWVRMMVNVEGTIVGMDYGVGYPVKSSTT